MTEKFSPINTFLFFMFLLMGVPQTKGMDEPPSVTIENFWETLVSATTKKKQGCIMQTFYSQHRSNSSLSTPVDYAKFSAYHIFYWLLNDTWLDWLDNNDFFLQGAIAFIKDFKKTEETRLKTMSIHNFCEQYNQAIRTPSSSLRQLEKAVEKLMKEIKILTESVDNRIILITSQKEDWKYWPKRAFPLFLGVYVIYKWRARNEASCDEHGIVQEEDEGETWNPDLWIRNDQDTYI